MSAEIQHPSGLFFTGNPFMERAPIVAAVIFCCLSFLIPGTLTNAQGVSGETSPGPIVLLNRGDSLNDIIRKAASVVPSPRQFRWQEREFIAFVHFGTNTFTDREWGLGTESPSVFNPTAFDARQWARVLRDAGMRMIIVTAKHHDGLCLWPSKFTDHTVARTPWRDGKGDVVGEVAAACREYGLEFGVYLSPWDRHEPSYGDSPRYNEHFRNQLRELLSSYGKVAEVWFDGACGEGPNGKKQVYDWQSYYRLIRELQPDAAIAIMGPDVRWVGTESGYGRETEWSVLPDIVQNPDSVAAASQQNPVDGAFVPGDLTAEDLGSREKIRGAKALVWYPAETDVSIRPGWFYHADQDDQVKTPAKLVDIYYNSVGKNSVLLLNVPADKRGLIHANDIRSLSGMRRILDETFKTNLLAGARVAASSEQHGHKGNAVIDGDRATYWTTEQGVDSAIIEFSLPRPVLADRAMFQEQIQVGQRIERFRLESREGTAWVPLARGTTIGYKRLLRFPPTTVSAVRLVIEQSRTSPTLSEVGLFKAPPRVGIEPDGAAFQDSIVVRLRSDIGGATIYYTTDGSEPTARSPRYTRPIVLKDGATIRAAAGIEGEPGVEVTEARFMRSRQIRSVTIEKTPSPKYPGSGVSTLVDGKRGSPDFAEKTWLGFEGDDFTATLDLGGIKQVKRISAGFLLNQGSWIFLPPRVGFSVSKDGSSWIEVAEIEYPVERTEKVLVKDFAREFERLDARFVRVRAKNIGTCPSWHEGAGGKAWLFVDEISIE